METTIKQKKDVYQIVTDRIIQQLEKGLAPWKKGWAETGMPVNLVSQKPYRGINLLLLSSLNYQQNYFLSFRQVMHLGGKVKQGEKSCPVVFWKQIEMKKALSDELTKVPMLRYYNVFNVAQCEGIPEEKIPVAPKPIDTIHACEEIVARMPDPPRIEHSGQQPCYNSYSDLVRMPLKNSFSDGESYYETLFHELIHSTGHEKRLCRKSVAKEIAINDSYSFEELVAETGACYLKSIAGISQKHFENNVAYIGGWLEKLRSDKRFVVYAGAQAQKAADYILGRYTKENVE